MLNFFLFNVDHGKFTNSGVSITFPPKCQKCICAKVVVCFPFKWVSEISEVFRLSPGCKAFTNVDFPHPECPKKLKFCLSAFPEADPDLILNRKKFQQYHSLFHDKETQYLYNFNFFFMQTSILLKKSRVIL
jgi:hypothetical protein